MIRHTVTARPGRDRDADSGYTEGRRAMPTAGEDRNESVYRNPVGAQCGMPLEGQKCPNEREGLQNARTGVNDSNRSGKAA